MRGPLFRFWGDELRTEPVEGKFAPIVILLLISSFILISALGFAIVIMWVAVSPVLPRSWRLNWDTAFDLDPTVESECPKCQSRLTLGPVDKRGHVSQTVQGREWVMPTQTADCLVCRRSFGRFSLGKVWSSWQDRTTPNPT